MRILHTMLRVGDLQRSIKFYQEVLGMRLLRTSENPEYKYSLAFDFAIFDSYDNLLSLIEYDGEQHFKSMEYFGGEESFKKTIKRDEIKDKYCKKNNIPLLRITLIDEDGSTTFLKIGSNLFRLSYIKGCIIVVPRLM